MQLRHLARTFVLADASGPGAAELYATTDEVLPANITVVRTAREFQEAFTSGAQDVQIRGHLDLSSLALAFSPGQGLPVTALGESSPSTRSIQVRLVAVATF